VCALLVLACVCPAPYERRPQGAKKYSELPESVSAQVQSGPVLAEGQPSPPPVTPIPSSQMVGSADKAALALSQAEEDRAADVIKAVHFRAEAQKPNPIGGLIIGGLLIALGGLVAFGLKSWADKAIPDSPQEKKKIKSAKG
jgi:hypothetical protein